jgi:hypothetical protein
VSLLVPIRREPSTSISTYLKPQRENPQTSLQRTGRKKPPIKHRDYIPGRDKSAAPGPTRQRFPGAAARTKPKRRKQNRSSMMRRAYQISKTEAERKIRRALPRAQESQATVPAPTKISCATAGVTKEATNEPLEQAASLERHIKSKAVRQPSPGRFRNLAKGPASTHQPISSFSRGSIFSCRNLGEQLRARGRMDQLLRAPLQRRITAELALSYNCRACPFFAQFVGQGYVHPAESGLVAMPDFFSSSFEARGG